MSGIIEKIFSTGSLLKNTEPLGEVPGAAYLLKTTAKMAWPSMAEAFLMAMVSFIDVLMISSLGDYAVAGVGLTSQTRLICIAVFTALQPAVSALVARRKGEDDRVSANRIFRIAMWLSLGLIIAVSALSVWFAGDIMRLAGSGENTHAYSVSYFQITMGGMVFNALTMVINAAQRGAGNTKVSLVTNVISNVVNIFFNFLLIGGNWGFPRLGVAGAAVATVIGQFVAFVLAVISVMQVESFISLRFKTAGPGDKRSAGALLKIGTGSLLEQLILRAGFLIYAVIVANLGELQFATHNIAMQFMTISFAFGDGLAIAAVSLVGFSLGQGRSDLAKIYGAFCQRLGMICSAMLCFVYIVFGRGLFSIFSKNAQVLRDGTNIMLLLTVIVIVQISQVIFSGCLRGSGDIKYITLVSFIGIGVLRPALAALFSLVLGWGVVGAWAGIVLDQIIRLIMTAVRFYQGKWIKIKI